jgi:hypothetical protein
LSQGAVVFAAAEQPFSPVFEGALINGEGDAKSSRCPRVRPDRVCAVDAIFADDAGQADEVTERMKPEMKKGMNPDVSIGLIAIDHAWFDCC